MTYYALYLKLNQLITDGDIRCSLENGTRDEYFTNEKGIAELECQGVKITDLSHRYPAHLKQYDLDDHCYKIDLGHIRQGDVLIRATPTNRRERRTIPVDAIETRSIEDLLVKVRELDPMPRYEKGYGETPVLATVETLIASGKMRKLHDASNAPEKLYLTKTAVTALRKLDLEPEKLNEVDKIMLGSNDTRKYGHVIAAETLYAHVPQSQDSKLRARLVNVQTIPQSWKSALLGLRFD